VSGQCSHTITGDFVFVHLVG